MSFLREIGRTALHGFNSGTLYPRLEASPADIAAVYQSAPFPLPCRVAPNAPNNDAADAPRDIRILSQNLWCHYLVSSPQKKDRLQDFLRVIPQFDVLCLQEVFTLRVLGLHVAGLKEWLIGEAQKLGFIFWTDTGSNWLGQDSGLLILSRFPILRSSYLTFNSFTLSELPNAKGALFATLDVRGKPLHVCCTHLDAHSPVCRSEQIAAITSHLPIVTQPLASAPPSPRFQFGEDEDEVKVDRIAPLEAEPPPPLSSPPPPVSAATLLTLPETVVVGDFNVLKGSQEHRESLLRQFRGFHDAACHSVDHMLISNNLKTSLLARDQHFFQTQNRAVSDHEGLSIVLAWPPRPTPAQLLEPHPEAMYDFPLEG